MAAQRERERTMLNPARHHLLLVVIALTFMLAGTAWADTLTLVTSPSAQGANDSLNWSQQGADGKVLAASFSGKTALGSAVTIGLAGANSVISVVCAATPCSWTGMGFTAGHSLLWTSDALNGGNGPVSLTFAKPVAGLGALLQADLPGAFTAKIQVFNGATSLGSFTVAGSTGIATYIGVLDKTGANITSAVFSLTSCATTCTDFALDTVAITTPAATATTLAASVNPSVFGQAVVFTATVSPNTATGTVTFKDGGVVLGTSTLVSGKAPLTSTSLAPGSHSITAAYSGSTAFLSSTSATLPHTVNKASTKTTVVSSHNPSVFGQSVTFTATVAAVAPGSGTPTGTVTFKNGTTVLGTGTLSGGKATFSTSALTPNPSPHSITVIYNGNVDFSSSTSGVLAQTVNKASTKTTVASSHNPSVFGQSVTFTATVTAVAPGSGTPTGTVTFKNGTTVLGTGTLSGGKATFSTSTLTRGAHSITAVYSGSVNDLGSTSAALTQTVN